MKTIKQSVIMVLTLLGVVVFSSGCASKEVYIPVTCKIEKPKKDVFNYSCNSKFKDDDYMFGKCIAEKIELLNGDYEKLEKAFDACKGI